MFRHPTVIAAFILSGGMFISAATVSAFIHSLDLTLREKPMVGYGSTTTVPDHMTLYTGNSSFRVALRNDEQPLIIQQRAPSAP